MKLPPYNIIAELGLNLDAPRKRTIAVLSVAILKSREADHGRPKGCGLMALTPLPLPVIPLTVHSSYRELPKALGSRGRTTRGSVLLGIIAPSANLRPIKILDAFPKE